MTVTSWTIPGYNDQPVFGNTHMPDGDDPAGVLVICHGFKGYKDYGFFPYLAHQAAKQNLIAHRFNFSHSGMTNNIDTFEKPDLFAIDTWSKQIHDLQQVHLAVQSNKIPGQNLPIAWFGHSRGGVTTLLAAGQGFAGDKPRPDALITAAAPSEACSLDEQTKSILKKHGKIESPSARTGQNLMVGRIWLDEIEADPDAHDVITATKSITCPLLIIHGQTDPTVPLNCAHILEQASQGNAKLHVIADAAHTFNSPNPLPLDSSPPAETLDMISAVCNFTAESLTSK